MKNNMMKNIKLFVIMSLTLICLFLISVKAEAQGSYQHRIDVSNSDLVIVQYVKQGRTIEVIYFAKLGTYCIVDTSSTTMVCWGEETAPTNMQRYIRNLDHPDSK